MKTLKYALAFLLLAVLTDGILVAAATPETVQTIRYLEGNNIDYGEYYTKEREGLQYYYNKSTYTTLTNPCNNCQIKVTSEIKGGGGSGTIIVTLGQTKILNNQGLYSPGKYRLVMQRVGFTLLTTYHSGTWYLTK